MLEQFDVLLFDADRTLFDTAAMETEALQKLMETLGYSFPETMPQQYYEINEGLWRRIETGELTRDFVRVERFRKLLEKYGIHEDPEQTNATYLSIFERCNRLIDGAELVCKTLQKEKQLAIITNGSASVQRTRFALASITPCFSHVFVSEELGISKPQKEFFQIVQREMNITDPKRVLIVGDSLTSDIRGGNNAGMPTCWFNPHGEKNTLGVHCDYEIHRLTDVLSLS